MFNYAYLVKVSIIQGDGQNLFRKTVLREIRYHAERKGGLGHIRARSPES
jgi:hypothetical protein